MYSIDSDTSDWIGSWPWECRVFTVALIDDRVMPVWQEGRSPSVVVELLSPGTAREDLGEDLGSALEEAIAEVLPPASAMNRNESEDGQTQEKPPRKWEVYEQILRVPHYFVDSRYDQQLRYFKLDGAHYVEQQLRSQPPLAWISELKIGIGIWQVFFEGVMGLGCDGVMPMGTGC